MRLWPFVALGAALLGAIAVLGPAMNVLPWVLAIVIAGAAALFAMQFVLRAAQEPDTFAAGAPLPEGRPGDLVAFGHVLGRARSGYPYSQAIAAGRAASAFLEKVRLSRGLSPSEMDRVRGDPVALLAVIGDRELTDFAYEWGREGRVGASDGGAGTAGKPFGATLSRTLEAMEAWS